MSVMAFDWASAQDTSDSVAKAVLVALGALADPDHRSRVDVGELSETINYPPSTVREILVELEAGSLIEVLRPVSSNGIGAIALQVDRSII